MDDEKDELQISINRYNVYLKKQAIPSIDQSLVCNVQITTCFFLSVTILGCKKQLFALFHSILICVLNAVLYFLKAAKEKKRGGHAHSINLLDTALTGKNQILHGSL